MSLCFRWTTSFLLRWVSPSCSLLYLLFSHFDCTLYRPWIRYFVRATLESPSTREIETMLLVWSSPRICYSSTLKTNFLCAALWLCFVDPFKPFGQIKSSMRWVYYFLSFVRLWHPSIIIVIINNLTIIWTNLVSLVHPPLRRWRCFVILEDIWLSCAMWIILKRFSWIHSILGNVLNINII